MLRVMLVDDEYMILEGLKKIINWRELGFEIVASFFSAEEALTYLEDETVDIIVSDILFADGMTGLDFLDVIKQRYPYIAFVLLSGHKEFDYAKRAVASGASDYLVKPIDKAELKRTLLRVKDEHVQLMEAEQSKKSDVFFRWLAGKVQDDELFSQLFWDDQMKKRLPAVWFLKEDCVLPASTEYVVFPLKKQLVFIIFRTVYESRVRKIVNRFEDASDLIIGDVFEDGAGLKQSFDLLSMHIESYSFYGQEGFVHLSDYSKDVPVEELEKLVETAFGISRLNQLTDIMDRMFQLFTQYYVHPDLVKHYTVRLAQSIERLSAEFSSQSAEERYWHVQQFKSIAEVAAYFWTLYKQYQYAVSLSDYSQLTRDVLKILKKHYAENLLLKDLAEMLHVNVMYLGQVLKKETNQTFSNLLNQMRISQSKELLRDTSKSIQEIALEVGYEPLYFYRVFKKFELMSPKEFREQAQCAADE
ncbi:response regulator transcription factor [Vagococcus acidifermentans]|uniref:DNA-binding response regulator n=1 Tax=Vagococcus acidifermentans TaxID=564710 RepID=A0A430AXQ1_9ENTE|nr:response regulator [Vagococcus acidifermentans]RSU12824.1 hypothetical protein CBF27_04615 [Vagococcus acidifermentans]